MDPAHSTTASRVERNGAWASRPVVLIAAVARNGVIGRDGRLPWHLPGDLAHFHRCTTGRPVVMGRRTYDGIGRPLPGRAMIVVSTDPGFTPAGITVARDLYAAFAEADRQGDACAADVIMVAGGAAIYDATIARADGLLLTLVDADPHGDTRFPEVDPGLWQKVAHRPARFDPRDTATYCFTRWERRVPLHSAGFMAEPG